MEVKKAKIGNALTSSAANHVVAVSGDIYDESKGRYQSDINEDAVRAKIVADKAAADIGVDSTILLQGGIDPDGKENTSSYYLRTSRFSTFKLEVNSGYTIGQLAQYDLGGNFVSLYNDYTQIPEGVEWNPTSVVATDKEYMWVAVIFKGNSPTTTISPREAVVKTFVSGLYYYMEGSESDPQSAAQQAKMVVDRTIEQLPNEEDLTFSDDGKMQLANRTATVVDGKVTNLGYVILRKDKSFAEQVVDANTIYEVRYEFDLNEETVEMPANCTLNFNGGKIINGAIVGNNTSCGVCKNIIFDNCQLSGTWNCAEAYASAFSTNDTLTLQSLCALSDVVNVNKDLYIYKNDVIITASKIYSQNPKKPTIHILNGEDGYNRSGLIFSSENVTIQNVCISEDYEDVDDNISTVGSALTTSETNKSLEILGCTFTGSYSSSCFATSKLTSIAVENCEFENIIVADHAVYCSVNVKNFTLRNIYVSGTALNGFFKLRQADINSLVIENIRFNGIYGYCFTIADTNIKVVELRNIFTLYVSDSNPSFWGNNNSNIDSLTFSNVTIFQSEDMSSLPIIYSSTGNQGTINAIFLNNINARLSSIPTVATKCTISNSVIGVTETNCELTITNSEIYSLSYKSRMVIGATNLNIINSVLTIDTTWLLECPAQLVNVNIQSSRINSLRRNLFLVKSEDTQINLNISPDSIISANTAYDIIDGATRAVLLKNPTGATEVRPSNVMAGFQFFDTTLSKPIWWNGSKWVDSTGTEV